MSKHIWRGLSCGHASGDFVLKKLGGYKANCTVIEDAACFPVREAMRLAKAEQEWANSGNCTGLCIAKTQRLIDAQADYRKAVAKMKARKVNK